MTWTALALQESRTQLYFVDHILWIHRSCRLDTAKSRWKEWREQIYRSYARWVFFGPIWSHFSCQFKEYGVKANLKTEDLIDLLLDSQYVFPSLWLLASDLRYLKNSSRSESLRSKVHTSTPVSVKQPSQTESKQANSSRTSSMVVHDLEEEEENEPRYLTSLWLKSLPHHL